MLDLVDVKVSDFGQPTLYMAFDAHNDKLPVYSYRPTGPDDNSFLESHGAFVKMLRNFTVLSCELFNASYTVDFSYTDSLQQVEIIRPNAQVDLPVEQPMNIFLGSEKQPESCANKTGVEQTSFLAINDAFNDLVLGKLPYQDANFDSGIVRTILEETDELPFLNSEQSRVNRWPAASFFVGQDNYPMRSRGPLIDLPERLFENMTVSMLSELALQ